MPVSEDRSLGSKRFARLAWMALQVAHACLCVVYVYVNVKCVCLCVCVAVCGVCVCVCVCACMCPSPFGSQMFLSSLDYLTSDIKQHDKKPRACSAASCCGGIRIGNVVVQEH